MRQWRTDSWELMWLVRESMWIASVPCCCFSLDAGDTSGTARSSGEDESSVGVAI